MISGFATCLTIVAFFIGAAAAQPLRTSAHSGLEASSIPIADSHVHLNDPEMQLRLMQVSRIRRAIVFWGRSSTNEKLVAWAREHPNHFVPFASISPERAAYRRYWDGNNTSLLGLLEDHLKEGVVRGIGEISVAHFLDGLSRSRLQSATPVMRGIMELAEQYRVPVNIHCEITRIQEFEQLLRSYPQVTVIWAHEDTRPTTSPSA